MAIPLYLAQTAAEFNTTDSHLEHIAWMACHFSPYGTGITNLPTYLPNDSLLILNDRTPPQGHDPKTVCVALMHVVEQFHCRGIVLDFQHSGCEKIVAEAVTLPCPVAVTELYAGSYSCPVFLSPVPLRKTLEEHLSRWRDREIWLEAAVEHELITITESGSTISKLPFQQDQAYPFYDEALHCSYHTEIADNYICFRLHRGRNEIKLLLDHAEKLGVALAVGLYQELRKS